MHGPIIEPASTATTSIVRRSLPSASREASRERQLGQVLPLFAIMSVVLLGGAALLTDVAWWWTSQQRMQRAADAGALSGAVYLPGNQSLAFARAFEETSKNGFTHGLGGVIVTPRRDPGDPRKLLVDIDRPVETHFARVLSLDHVDVGVTGAATYTLPVPMGSPQNYYGVGFFQGVGPRAPLVSSHDTGWGRVASSSGSGSWTASSGNIVSAVNSDDSAYAYATTNGQQQVWSTFGLATGGLLSPIPNPLVGESVAINGIEVRLTDTLLNGSCANSRIEVAISWNGGSSWSTTIATPNLGTSETDHILPASGGSSSTSAWGGRTWTRNDFTDANFRVRLQAVKGCSTAGRQLRVDMLEVRVRSTLTGPTSLVHTVLDVPDPLGGTLPSQGFWGAIFTSGGVRENGDRYAPLYIGAGNPPDGVNGGPNPDYERNGYDYTIELGANGQVRLFDPVFCATGRNLSGGWLGAGDHWTTDGTGGGTTVAPVAIEFKLFDTQGTPSTRSDDIQVGSTLTYDPGSATLGTSQAASSRRAARPRTGDEPTPRTAPTTLAIISGSSPAGGAGWARGRIA